MDPILGTDVLADLFDTDPSNLTHLWKKGVITRIEPGRYPLVAITQYIRYLRDRSKGKRAPLPGGSMGGEGDSVDEKNRLLKAQADIAEHKLAVLRGDVHSASDVKLIVGNMVAQFKQRALTVPHKLAPLLASKKPDAGVYEAVIKEEILAVLNILKDYNPEDYGISSPKDDRPIQDDSDDSDSASGTDSI